MGLTEEKPARGMEGDQAVPEGYLTGSIDWSRNAEAG